MPLCLLLQRDSKERALECQVPVPTGNVNIWHVQPRDKRIDILHSQTPPLQALSRNRNNMLCFGVGIYKLLR